MEHTISVFENGSSLQRYFNSLSDPLSLALLGCVVLFCLKPVESGIL